MYCKGLSKETLENAGIVGVEFINGEWVIRRLWYKNSSKAKTEGTIKVTLARGKHKYRPDKFYPKVTFCVKQKAYNIPLSRLIYVWFKGDIPDGYVVDHIDNNSFNNHPENLQLLTIEDNLKKRYEDNPNAWTNQWGRQKGWDKHAKEYK